MNLQLTKSGQLRSPVSTKDLNFEHLKVRNNTKSDFEAETLLDVQPNI